MKRALLLALAALLALAPAAQALTALVSVKNQGTSNPWAATEIQAVTQGIMDETGSTYRWVPWSLADTTFFRTGYLRDTLTHTGVQFDVVVVPGAFTGAASTATYDPLAVTRPNRWPLVPVVLIGIAGNVSTGVWAEGSSPAVDSTGVKGNPAGQSNYKYRYYDVATGLGWQGTGVGGWMIRQTAGVPNPTYTLRGVIGAGASSVQLDYGGGAPFSNRDTVEAVSANPDTLALWVKYAPVSLGTMMRNAPVIMAHMGGAGSSAYDASLAFMALAMADSVSGHKVFDNPKRLPVRYGINIGPYFSTSSVYTNSTTLKTGIFCRPDSCDSANAGTTMQALKRLGGRYTIGVQIDSLTGLAWQKPYLALLGTTARFTPMDYSGTAAPSGGLAMKASKNRILDVWGETRARTLIPPDSTGLPCGCPAADSSIYCLARSSFAKLDSLYPGQVDHVLAAPGLDWGGHWSKSITRENGRTLDSLIWVMYMAGVRGIEVNPLDQDPASNEHGSGTGPWGNLLTRSGYYPVRDSAGTYLSQTPNRRVLYQMPILADRHYEEAGAWNTLPAAHDYSQEFLWGRFVSPWYRTSTYPFYRHDFMTKLYVFRVATSSMGGAGQGTTPYRPGYWQIRRLLLTTDVINRLGGRTLITSDWTENVAKTARLDR